MSRRIKFHLDENVSNAIAEGLRQRSVEVTTSSEAHLIGASDEEHLAYALAQGEVIFTMGAATWLWGVLTAEMKGVRPSDLDAIAAKAAQLGQSLKDIE